MNIFSYNEVYSIPLTAFVYVSGDVDGSGVVRDETFEVGVYFKVLWNEPVALVLFFIFIFFFQCGLIYLCKWIQMKQNLLS